MIELINVCKSYKNKVVIKNFNYKFNDFGLYFLVGKSGSGKTTLLNLITQMIEPSSGNIIYSNLDSIYKDTYYAYQDFNLFSSLTVLENIRMLANIKKIEINDELIDNTLNELNIFELKDSKANEISGGERQRLSIAIALILKTKVLILDEPTANLDDNNAHNLMDIVRKLANSILIIVSTHDKSLLNENDSIIDMQNISKELVESENIAKSTEKRINLGKSVSLNSANFLFCSVKFILYKI
jgi:putative ABC transport system ATP-binding protein